MNVHRKIAKLFVFALAATALSVGSGNAQDFHGKFTLPFEAQWGEITLKPGNYTLALGRAAGGQTMAAVRSEAAGSFAAMILPEGHNASPSLSQDDLVCIRQGGRLVVRSLEIAQLGETIYFHMPKGARLSAQRRGNGNQTLLAEAPQLLERLPVTSSGK